MIAFTVNGVRSEVGVDEDTPPLAPNAIPLNLPSRFEFTRAVQFEGKWTGIPQLTLDGHWTYDLANQSGLQSKQRPSVIRVPLQVFAINALGIGISLCLH